MHPTLYLHAPGYQRGIAVQLGCQILARVTFQCCFGVESPEKKSDAYTQYKNVRVIHK
jgi:hypothetical protein